MKYLTIKAASRESAFELCSVLGQFYAELELDEGGDYLVSVELGNEQRIVEVFGAIDGLVSRRGQDGVSSMALSVDERPIRQRPTASHPEGQQPPLVR